MKTKVGILEDIRHEGVICAPKHSTELPLFVVVLPCTCWLTSRTDRFAGRPAEPDSVAAGLSMNRGNWLREGGEELVDEDSMQVFVEVVEEVYFRFRGAGCSPRRTGAETRACTRPRR